MELSPQAVAAATFKTVKRGYDPDEVRAYLVEVSASLESSHQQATAMEARARAAIAKLQDATQSGGVALAPVPEEADTISRTLLLAQRTADTAVAEARAEAASIAAKAEIDAVALTSRAEAEAASITSVARAEAVTVVDQANATAARLVEDARAEARRTKDDEQLRAEREVHTLMARREALLSDVDTLEEFAARERDRLRSVSTTMLELADSEAGLAAFVRPDLAAGSELPAPTSNGVVSSGGATEPMPPPVSEPFITGQIPIVGAQPLVSPMPSSNEEARSMWHEAELADAAALAGDDTVPMESGASDAATDDTGETARADEESTPAEGLRIGGEELS
jgi:DivIVA domain-containing protein